MQLHYEYKKADNMEIYLHVACHMKCINWKNSALQNNNGKVKRVASFFSNTLSRLTRCIKFVNFDMKIKFSFLNSLVSFIVKSKIKNYNIKII